MSEETKLAKKVARRLVEESGDDGINILAIVDEVLEDHPEAAAALARQGLSTYIENFLRSARTPEGTPAFGVGDEGRWKQAELFDAEECRSAIVRRLKSIRKDVDMVNRMIAEGNVRYQLGFQQLSLDDFPEEAAV